MADAARGFHAASRGAQTDEEFARDALVAGFKSPYLAGRGLLRESGDVRRALDGFCQDPGAAVDALLETDAVEARHRKPGRGRRP